MVTPPAMSEPATSSTAPAADAPAKAAKRAGIKFSELFKDKKIVQCITKFHPLMWLKLKMCSRILGWRLPDDMFSSMLPYLNDQLGIGRPDLNIHEVAEVGDVDSLWLMVLQGVSVRMKCPYTQATLLQKAVHSGNPNLVHMLLAKNASPNVKGTYGYTALHECAYTATARVARLLCEYKANCDAISKNGSTPLLVAAREGKTEIVAELLKHNAHPDDGGDKGWTPLFLAASEGHVAAAEVLLAYGANPNEVALQEGRTPLEEAIAQNKPEMAALLHRHMGGAGDAGMAAVEGVYAAAATTQAQHQLLQTQHAIHELQRQRQALEQHFMTNPNDPAAAQMLEQNEIQLEQYLLALTQVQAQVQAEQQVAALQLPQELPQEDEDEEGLIESATNALKNVVLVSPNEVDDVAADFHTPVHEKQDNMDVAAD
ncbi:unnamed protein product [Amoebophrya sp. A120]|nr:unnamed protein product [Amoebophrya sp. A120]|eukprot:GSA120T00002323001.1